MVADAVENEWCIVLIIDDYTTVHSKHRPKEKVSSAASMCTIVCRVFPDVRAIPLTAIEDFHNPNGVDITLLQAAVTNMNMMDKISKTYADGMPPWLISTFFDPESERHRLQTHMYKESDNLRKMRSLDNLFLIDFVEQPLKSKEDFQSAMDIASDALRVYMEKYAVLLPGDWPAQFHLRKVVYSSCGFHGSSEDRTESVVVPSDQDQFGYSMRMPLTQCLF